MYLNKLQYAKHLTLILLIKFVYKYEKFYKKKNTIYSLFYRA